MGNAATQTAFSPLLLRYYVQHTAKLLVAKPADANPFINILLPMAYYDTLFMNAVLALSGQHLLGHKTSGAGIQRAVWHHYGMAIREMRVASGEAQARPISQTLRLLAAVLVLCNVEAFCGERPGALITHLRGARHLVTDLMQYPTGSLTADEKRCAGFVLETFAFLTLISNVTPYGFCKDRVLPFDPFTLSLKHLESYETYQIFLGCGREAFEHIPRIALLAQQRLREEESDDDEHPFQTTKAFDQLLCRIKNWTLPPASPHMAHWQAEHAIYGEIWRNALILYLETSRHGSHIPRDEAFDRVQDYVNIACQLWATLNPSPYCTTMMWPGLIVGSCMIREDQQQALQSAFLQNGFATANVSRAMGLLGRLWADEDERVFGPYGIGIMMEKHGIDLCMV